MATLKWRTRGYSTQEKLCEKTPLMRVLPYHCVIFIDKARNKGVFCNMRRIFLGGWMSVTGSVKPMQSRPHSALAVKN
jgi:hypothetical protein